MRSQGMADRRVAKGALKRGTGRFCAARKIPALPFGYTLPAVPASCQRSGEKAGLAFGEPEQSYDRTERYASLCTAQPAEDPR